MQVARPINLNFRLEYSDFCSLKIRVTFKRMIFFVFKFLNTRVCILSLTKTQPNRIKNKNVEVR